MDNLIARFKRFVQNRSAATILLILSGIIVYANCIPNAMFWDDNDFIFHNTYIQDWRWWPHFFTDNLISGAHLVSNYWRPLLQIIFAIEWHLWADWTPGWHLTSVVVHTLAGVVLFKALDILLNNRIVAFLTALIFIIHPVQTESVVYPNSMGDALAAIFAFSGLYFFTRYKLLAASKQRGLTSIQNYLFALLMYPLALMSKETGILLVAYLALTDYFLFIPEKSSRTAAWHIQRIIKTLRTILPFIVIAAGYIVLRATKLL